MNVYSPDYWCVLKLQHSSGIVYKVFGSWSGSYLEGDYWRLNSGIKQATLDKDEDFINFAGYSGSVYKCHKDFYRVYPHHASLLQQWTNDPRVELLSESTDWLTKDWTT